jgi:hypothetical protein
VYFSRRLKIMKINKVSDILLNVFLPLLLGGLIYLVADSATFLPVKNYFPDGLWAYSFLSAILILWNRSLNYFWIGLSFLVAICFELLQYLHWLRGTGDIADTLVYFAFFMLALVSNRLFKQYGSLKSA